MARGLALAAPLGPPSAVLPVATAAWAPDPALAAVKLYEVVLVAAATFGLARALWSDDSGRV
ncbi:hypothetical protein, partial [Anaeromyxobacter sp. SG66]|uniref:hypothetical protein n=1 Tax=Anaeromyxobacter sp. SG66 TaxID=2925410 RepID=UPI001F577731